VKATTLGTFLPDKHDVNFRCGISRLDNDKVNFIIGGEPSKLQEFPFAVLLVIFFFSCQKWNKLNEALSSLSIDDVALSG
jgi:hypothetical protein